MSRNKGAGYERLVAKALREFWPDARRGIGQARSAKEVADVEGCPFWIETKRRKRCSIEAAWRQAAAATDGRPLLVVTKEDHCEALATLELTPGRRVTMSWALLLETLRQGWRPTTSTSAPSTETPVSKPG